METGKQEYPSKKRDFGHTDGKTLNYFRSCSRNIPSRFRLVPVFSRKYENGTCKNGIRYRTKRVFPVHFHP
jgi:hypothetical protein